MKLALIALIGAAAAAVAYADPAAPSPASPEPAKPAPAAASPTQSQSAPCFRTFDMAGHTVADAHTMYVGMVNHDVYRFEMAGSCLAAASSTDPIVLRSPPGSTYVCQPIDLQLSIVLGGFPHGIQQFCIVKSLTRLSSTEVAALPKRLRPTTF
jgi:hypothetical protein